MGYLLTIIGVIILIFIGSYFSTKENIENIKLKLNELNNQYNKVVVLGYEKFDNSLNYVGFNNNTKEMTVKNKNQKIYTIKYDDIVNAELVENGQTILNIESIAMGGLLAGNIGAIIGGMNKKQKILSRVIKLNVNSFINTTQWINLMDNGGRVDFVPNIIYGATPIIDTINYILNNK